MKVFMKLVQKRSPYLDESGPQEIPYNQEKSITMPCNATYWLKTHLITIHISHLSHWNNKQSQKPYAVPPSLSYTDTLYLTVTSLRWRSE